MRTMKAWRCATAVALTTAAAAAMADDTGVDRAVRGTTDAVTAPVRVVEGIGDETRRNGPVAGAVVGTAKGTVHAAGQVVRGGAEIAVGAVEVGVGVVRKIIEPVTGR